MHSALGPRSFAPLVVVPPCVVRVCVLGVLGKIKDLRGLFLCDRPKAVVNLVWHHQIRDQRVILEQLKGLERALLSCNHF